MVHTHKTERGKTKEKKREEKTVQQKIKLLQKP